MLERRLQDAGAQRRIGAALGEQIDLLRDQMPGAIATRPHANAHRIAQPGGNHRFGAIELQADRATALECK